MAKELPSSSALDSEAFRLYCYKIVPCAKKYGHDWSECPFAHEGEKATRRCPALYRYSSIVCPEIRQSKTCPRGDICPYSHSIFEYWMHPARFRAQLCSFGSDCNRRICFFAHTHEQLRVPSEPLVSDALASRAPFLQDRLPPDSRYALFPEQVPALLPLQQGGVVVSGGGGGPRLLQPQQELGGALAMQQLVYVPAPAPGPVVGSAGLALGGSMAVGGPALAPAQQWAAAAPGGAGGGIVYLPTGAGGQAGGGGAGGVGYLTTASAAAGPGSSGAGGMAALAVEGYSGPMLLPPGMQLLGSGYGGAGTLQMMAAVGADGSISHFPVAASMAGSGGMYAPAPVYAAATPAGAGLAGAQQAWGSPQPQQPPPPQAQQPGPQQPHMQLVQVQDVAPGTGGGLGRRHQDSSRGFLLSPAGQLAGAAGLGPGAAVDPQQYAVAVGPGLQQHSGAAVVPGGAVAPGAPGDSSGAAATAQAAAAAAGAPGSVDDITQQMSGWQIQ